MNFLKKLFKPKEPTQVDLELEKKLNESQLTRQYSIDTLVSFILKSRDNPLILYEIDYVIVKAAVETLNSQTNKYKFKCNRLPRNVYEIYFK